MPKLRKPPSEKKLREIVRLIKDLQFYHEVSAKQIAKAAGVSEVTYYKRMKNPEQFTIEELTGMGRVLHFDFFLREREL